MTTMHTIPVDADGEPVYIGPVTARPVDELGVGSRWWTPAGRWETVTGITHDGGYTSRVETAELAAGHAWSMSKYRIVASISAYELPRQVVVCMTHSTITAYITSGGSHEHDLAQATAVRGSGWLLWDRPTGGDTVQEQIASKASARSAIVRRAKAHAKALKLPFGGVI